MKFLPVALIALALLCPARMLRADDASDRTAAAEEMIKAMHADVMIDKMMAKQKEAIMKMIPALLPKDLPPAELQKVQDMMPKIMDSTFKQLTWESLKPDFIQIYSETFTVEEMKGLANFYNSPLGQSLITKMPELSAKSMQIMQKRIPGMMADMQKTIKDTIAQQKAAAADSPAAPQ